MISFLEDNRRFTDFPVTIQDLKTHGVAIHAICLSHAHNDHIDVKLVHEIVDYYPQVQIITGLHVDRMFSDAAVAHALDWWDKLKIHDDDSYVQSSRKNVGKAGSRHSSIKLKLSIALHTLFRRSTGAR